jgi:hypothetical protein
MAENSPLSRWASQPVVKHLQFQLSLDDPKLPEDKQVTLRGDRAQLEALYEAVTNYVQNLLQQPAAAFSINGRTTDIQPPTLTLLERPTPALYSSPEINQPAIHLKPKGLLQHELALGSLATEEAGPTVNLSTLQLFDLANALEEYTTDILDLPSWHSAPRFGWSRNWAQIAAVGLLAVGLSTSAIRLLDGSRQQPGQVPISSEGASSADQKIAIQLPPAVVDQATPPVLSDNRLPPPPPAGSVMPGTPGAPAVAVPSTPAPAASTTKPSGGVASNPVPVPGRPTILGQPVAPITGNAPQAPQVIAIAPPAADTAPPAASQSSSPLARRGALLQESAANTPSTAFDTIPQVAEVRDYFQERWKPIEGLTQTLEYSLILNPNGTIQNITPLKQASGDYIDRTGMPLLGDPFVSPLKDGKTAKIRLVLEPDGKVKTFLEAL